MIIKNEKNCVSMLVERTLSWTRPDTGSSKSRRGWAGAVMWRAGKVGSAVHTRASVTCNWLEALMPKLLAKCQKCLKSEGGTNRETDGLTDTRTDAVTYRVAWPTTIKPWCFRVTRIFGILILRCLISFVNQGREKLKLLNTSVERIIEKMFIHNYGNIFGIDCLIV